MYKIVVLLFTLIFFGTLIAEQRVQNILITGNKRTKESTVLNLSRITIGDTLTDSLLQETKQHLLNSRLFEEVTVDTLSGEVVTIHLKERWTTIMLNKVALTDNDFSFMIGLYDNNAFGRALTLGAKYDNFGNADNITLWGSKKEISRHRLTLAGALSTSTRTTYWYKYDAAQNKLLDDGNYKRKRDQISVAVEYPFKENFYLGFDQTFIFDTIMISDTLDTTTSVYKETQLSTYNSSPITLLPELSFIYRNFDYHQNYTISGWGLKLSYSRGFVLESNDYNSVSLSAQKYFLLPFSSNLVLYSRTLFSDVDGLNYLYLGGTNAVRGYISGEFRGRVYSNATIEYRVPSIQTKWLVVQHALFSDGVTIAKDIDALSTHEEYFSVGTGIRLLSPKVTAFMLRFDYAWGFGEYRRNGYYLGSGRFVAPF